MEAYIGDYAPSVPMTIIGTPSFIRVTVAFLATNPHVGDIGGQRRSEETPAGEPSAGERVIYYFYSRVDKNETVESHKAEWNDIKPLLFRLVAGYRTTKSREPSAGSRVVATLREAVDWVEGKDAPVRITTVEVPAIDLRAARKRLGSTPDAFAANFGFQQATLLEPPAGQAAAGRSATGAARRDRSSCKSC